MFRNYLKLGDVKTPSHGQEESGSHILWSQDRDWLQRNFAHNYLLHIGMVLAKRKVLPSPNKVLFIGRESAAESLIARKLDIAYWTMPEYLSEESLRFIHLKESLWHKS